MSREIINRSWSLIDNTLIKGAAAGKSPEELSASINGVMSAAECLLHVRQLLQSRNVWELPERKQLVLIQLQNLAEDVSEAFRKSKTTEDGSLLLKTLSKVSDVLEKQGTLTEEELRRVSEAQARELLHLILSAFKKAEDKLTASHPEIDVKVVHDYFHEGLEEASRERYGDFYQ